jgi:hypothetical protein
MNKSTTQKKSVTIILCVTKNAKGFATKNAQFPILKILQSSIHVQLTTATLVIVINVAALFALTLMLV